MCVDSDRVDHSDVVSKCHSGDVNGTGHRGSHGSVRSNLRASLDLARRPAVYRVRGLRYVREKTLGMKRSPIRLPMVGRIGTHTISPFDMSLTYMVAERWVVELRD